LLGIAELLAAKEMPIPWQLTPLTLRLSRPVSW
jgi:hypothetical protein